MCNAERREHGNAISFPRPQITALFLLLPTEEFSLHQTSLMPGGRLPDFVPDEYTLDILLPGGQLVVCQGNGEYSRGYNISWTATTGMKACSRWSHFASNYLLAWQRFIFRLETRRLPSDGKVSPKGSCSCCAWGSEPLTCV